MTKSDYRSFMRKLYKDFLRYQSADKGTSDIIALNAIFELAFAIKDELNRLYYADPEMDCATFETLKKMIKINRVFQVIPFNEFGSAIKIKE